MENNIMHFNSIVPYGSEVQAVEGIIASHPYKEGWMLQNITSTKEGHNSKVTVSFRKSPNLEEKEYSVYRVSNDEKALTVMFGQIAEKLKEENGSVDAKAYKITEDVALILALVPIKTMGGIKR